jgi:hypothetical protein
LEHLILFIAEDDWLPIGDASAHAADFETDVPERKARLLRAIGQLAEQGYLRIGDLQYQDPKSKTGLHWAEWPGTLEQQMERLEAIYTPEVEDSTYWYDACWLDLTAAGHQIVESLPAPDERFFEGI